jgi:hypothetical protein
MDRVRTAPLRILQGPPGPKGEDGGLLSESQIEHIVEYRLAQQPTVVAAAAAAVDANPTIADHETRISMILSSRDALARVPVIAGASTDGSFGIPSGDVITAEMRAAALEGDGNAASDASLGVWGATQNDLLNTDFSGGITSWNVVAATRSVVTTPVKYGANSLQVVCSGGSATLYQQVTTAGLVGAGVRSASVWVYVAPGSPAIGKNLQLHIGGTGGATGYLAFATKIQVAVAGWQKLTVTGTEAQTDRTTMQVSIILSGAVAGDTFVVNAPQMERSAIPTPYVPSTTIRGVRDAARIRFPLWRVSAREGWLAVQVRLPWASTAKTDTAVLGRWGDSTTYIELAWTGTALRLRRATASGTQDATRSIAFPANSVLTVVGAWTADRVLLSVNGEPLHRTLTATFSDDFARADSSGSLGTAPTGQTWIKHGDGVPAIVSGRYVHDNTSTRSKMYMRIDLAAAPYRRTAQVSFAGTPGIQTAVALISSDDPATTAAGNAFDHMLHPVIGAAAWSLNTYDAFVGSPLIASGNWPLVSGATVFDAGMGVNRLLFDGTVYDITLDVDPATSTLTLLVMQGANTLLNRTITHADIATHHGRYTIWQLYEPTSGSDARFEAVSASTPDASASAASYIPASLPVLADIGSNAGTASHLSGDVLWVDGGNGAITDAEAAALSAVSALSDILDAAPGGRHVWSAVDE